MLYTDGRSKKSISSITGINNGVMNIRSYTFKKVNRSEEIYKCRLSVWDSLLKWQIAVVKRFNWVMSVLNMTQNNDFLSLQLTSFVNKIHVRISYDHVHMNCRIFCNMWGMVVYFFYAPFENISYKNCRGRAAKN